MPSDPAIQRLPAGLFEDRWRRLNGAAAMLLGFSIPLDPTAVTVASVLFLVAWIGGGRYRDVPTLLRREPATAIAVVLFALFLAGIAWSIEDFGDAFRYAKKYRELLLLPLLMTAIDDERSRRAAVAAFMAGVAVNLAMSYAQWADWLPRAAYGSPSGLHIHLVYGVLVATLAYWAAHRAAEAVGAARYLWTALVLLVAHNVFYVVASRTGYLIFAVFAFVFIVQRFRGRRLVALVVALAALAAAIYGTSPLLRYRVDTAIVQLLSHKSGEVGGSTHQRLDMWEKSVGMIAASPLLGHGTGSFNLVHRKLYPDSGKFLSHPHNEYLMIGVQLGLVGAALFVMLLVALWRGRVRLDREARLLVEGLLVAYAVDSLLNATLLDHTEGHWFGFLVGVLFAQTAGHGRPASIGASR